MSCRRLQAKPSTYFRERKGGGGGGGGGGGHDFGGFVLTPLLPELYRNSAL